MLNVRVRHNHFVLPSYLTNTFLSLTAGVVLPVESPSSGTACVCPDAPAEAQKSGVQPWHCCHKLIYVRPNPKTGVPIGHWPIPEAFWPDQNSPTLVRINRNILQEEHLTMRLSYRYTLQGSTWEKRRA